MSYGNMTVVRSSDSLIRACRSFPGQASLARNLSRSHSVTYYIPYRRKYTWASALPEAALETQLGLVLTEQQGVDVSIAQVGPAPVVVALGDADGALAEGDVVGRETPEVATVGVPEDGLGEATCLESLDVGLELDVSHLGGGRAATREGKGGDGGNARHQDSRVATTELTDTHMVYYSRFIYFVNN